MSSKEVKLSSNTEIYLAKKCIEEISNEVMDKAQHREKNKM